MSRLLTVQELAKVLKISVKTVYNLVSQRRIPFAKAGGALRFDPIEIRVWLKRASRLGRKGGAND